MIVNENTFRWIAAFPLQIDDAVRITGSERYVIREQAPIPNRDFCSINGRQLCFSCQTTKLTNRDCISVVLHPESRLVTGCMRTNDDPIIVAIDSDRTIGQIDPVTQNNDIASV